MSKLFLKYLSSVVILYLLSMAVDTIIIRDIPSLLLMGLVLLLVNLLIKPLLLLLTLPVNIITFNIFSFVVNAWTIMLADLFVKGITMNGFLNSLLAAFLIAVLQHLLITSRKDAHDRN
ncbi:MAG: putative rane protein [Firmicutes bacterium]|nr:putative rane protein [Bacillota bacterium]